MTTCSTSSASNSASLTSKSKDLANESEANAGQSEANKSASGENLRETDAHIEQEPEEDDNKPLDFKYEQELLNVTCSSDSHLSESQLCFIDEINQTKLLENKLNIAEKMLEDIILKEEKVSKAGEHELLVQWEMSEVEVFDAKLDKAEKLMETVLLSCDSSNKNRVAKAVTTRSPTVKCARPAVQRGKVMADLNKSVNTFECIEDEELLQANPFESTHRFDSNDVKNDENVSSLSSVSAINKPREQSNLSPDKTSSDTSSKKKASSESSNSDEKVVINPVKFEMIGKQNVEASNFCYDSMNSLVGKFNSLQNYYLSLLNIPILNLKHKMKMQR